MSDSFRIGSLPRAGLGLLLVASSAALLVVSRDVDWGVGWMVWIPALVLLFPAASLMRQISLRFAERPTGTVLLIEHGILWRRGYEIPTAGAEVEVVPMAGFQGVIWHVGGRAWPLALWIGRRRALQLVAWLDSHATAMADGRWARRETRRAEWDR